MFTFDDIWMYWNIGLNWLKSVSPPDMYGAELAKKSTKGGTKAYLYRPCMKKNLPYQRRNY